MGKSMKGAGLLESVSIAAPCPVEWSSMEGEGERKRFCGQCQLHVYNISDMTGAEAEDFLLASEGKERTCIRLFRRADGTILTDNCPVGLRKIRDAARRVWRVAAAAAAFLISANGSFAQRVEQGDVYYPSPSGAIAPPQSSPGANAKDRTVRVNNEFSEIGQREAHWPKSIKGGGQWAAGGIKLPPVFVAPPNVTVQTDPTCGPESKNKTPAIQTWIPKVDLKVTAKVVNKADAWQRMHSQGTVTAQLIVSPVVLVSSPRDERASAQGKEMLKEAVHIALKSNDYMRAASSLNNIANYSYYERNTEQALKEYQKALEYAKLEDPAMDSPVFEAIRANMSAIAERSGLTLVAGAMVHNANYNPGEEPAGLAWIAGVNGSTEYTPFIR